MADHFRSFDTICSATQERQDAVLALHRGAAGRDGGGGRLQLEQHLPSGRAGPVEAACRTYHIEDADCVDPLTGTLRHQPIGAKAEVDAAGWLGEARVIGITAGASTPNNKVGETIDRICQLAGVAEELRAADGQ